LAAHPLAVEPVAIRPLHQSIAVPISILESAFVVDKSVCQNKPTVPMWLAVLPLAVILQLQYVGTMGVV
jgi:hypothetical protein